MSGRAARAWVAGLALATASCGKVPVVDVQAGFLLADVAWFAEEETLFVFYDVSAEQGLGDPSVVEVTWATDDGPVDWTPLEDLSPVHLHLPVDCGTKHLCGSASVHVPLEPRDVRLRLRYHRDGELALDADTVFNVVGPGPAWSARSYLVYGVFDETNRRVQWRGRNRFPTIRNEQASELGLRRQLVVGKEVYGDGWDATGDNPYGYGVACPADFEPAGLGEVETDERAVFDAEELPADASDAAVVCAQAMVTDGTGTFTTGAVARKNPEVRPAFPELRSPIRDATPLSFFLEPCDRTISAEHEAMQRQRLLLGDLPPLCIDDWEDPGFRDRLVVAFSDAVEAARPDGRDMVLVIGLHQDASGVAAVVQEALAEVVPAEAARASPRLAGAFVFDSDTGGLTVPEIARSTLWCPTAGEDDPASSASLTCAIAPDDPDIELGPFSFGVLPILPSREQYLEFIDTYSEGQAGEVTALTFRAPEFATTSDHVDIAGFAVATFLNDEVISASPSDAFSHCVTDQPWVFVFRSEALASDVVQAQLAQACAEGGLSEEVCVFAASGVLPVEILPEWHDLFAEDTYELGLAWDFPFLVHMEYRMFVAGALTAFGFTVPFGLGQDGESYYGSPMWATEVFPLAEELTQCTRFCDHPTFDSAGVYQVGALFRSAYAHACYHPDYPRPGDSGFPLDP